MALAQEVEMEPKKIINIYARDGTFVIDFLTAIPWVFIIDASTAKDSTTQKLARLFCLVHGIPFIRSVFSSKQSWISDQMTAYIRKYDINISAVQAFKILAAMFLYWFELGLDSLILGTFILVQLIFLSI